MAKVFGWYDNEWGYTNRLVDLTELFAGAGEHPRSRRRRRLRNVEQPGDADCSTAAWDPSARRRFVPPR